MRDMVTLTKAVKYAGQFVSKDKARPIFNYVLIKGDEVISSDTRSVIRCKVNGVHEPQLISIKDSEIVSEPTKYPDVSRFFQVKRFSKTKVVFTSGDTNIRECFRKLAVIFDTCKRLTSREIHRVCLRTKGDELLIFSGENGELMFFEHSVSDVEGEPISCAFNADYLSRVCKVIADVNPSIVGMYFFKGGTVLIKMDSVQIYGCGINLGKAEWLTRKAEKYCEVE